MNSLLGYFEKSNKQAPLQEATYYGKNSDLIMMEALCQSLINKGRTDKYDNIYSKTILPIEKILERLFNLKSVSIELTPDIIPNAATAGVYISDKQDSWTNSPFEVIKGPYGPIMKNKDNNIWININKALLVIPGFTGAHLTAVILHEIGHSFDRAPATIYRNIGRYWSYKNSYTKGYNSDTLKTDPEMKKIRNRLDKNKKIQKLFKDDYKNTLKSYTLENKNIFELIIDGVFDTMIMPILVFFNVFTINESYHKYTSEQFADSFATAFGYGKEISEAVVMIMNYAKTLNAPPKLTGFSEFILMYNLIIMKFSMYFAPTTYQHEITRAMDNIKYLDIAIAKIDNPKLKQEAINDRNELVAYLDSYYDMEAPTSDEVEKFLHTIGRIVNVPEFKSIFQIFKTKYPGLDLEE